MRGSVKLNREIKFRAWDKNREKFLEQEKLIVSNNLVFESFRDLEDWTPETNSDLMQYTCFKDKNGVEIYEGDIVEVAEHHFDTNGNFNGNYLVEWHEESLTYLAGNLLLFRLKPYITVIGNVHENPELLKKV